MRGIQISQTGAASVLALNSALAKPTPQAGQVLVKNLFAGVNFIDVYHRTGLYPLPLPFIPGREASGIVEAVGEGVSHLKVGDRVAYFSAGSYAEYTCANATNTARVPDGIPMEQAAIANVAGITALMLSQEIYNVQKGDFVLVHAAAGGVGQTLCQILSAKGAMVIGTTSSEHKAELARRAGATHVILYTQQDVAAEVMKLTSDNGCRLVLDGVGKATFESSLASTATRGHLICFGNASGKPDPFDITRLTKGSKILCRPTMADFIKTHDDYQRLAGQVFELMKKNQLKFEINKMYDLQDASKAHEDLESRNTTGKLVLRIQ